MIRENPSPKHGYPGRLFVFEGLDGSGKSTQAALLGKWLAASGYRVFSTEWNSSELVSSTIRRGKKKGLLTPTTFSLMHAVDFADRFERTILPPPGPGTSSSATATPTPPSSVTRPAGATRTGCGRSTRSPRRPDVAFYFRVPVRVTLERKIASRLKINYYEAGMDLGLSEDLHDSYERFQGRIKKEYRPDRGHRPDDDRRLDPRGGADPGRAAERGPADPAGIPEGGGVAP